MAPEIEPNDISPFVADVFLQEMLTAHAGLMALVEGRIAPAIDGFEPSELVDEDAAPETAWPYVLFGEDGDAQFDTHASDLVMQRGQFLLRGFMREDIAASRGHQFEDIAARIQRELLKAVQGVPQAQVDGEWGGTVHECQLLKERHRTVYGERGRRTCEMGVRVRISTT
jgi:hypothetical protein